MKRIIKLIFAISTIIILISLIALSLKYSPVYTYRLISMNLADVYDYKYFENRTIKGSDSTFQFPKTFDEEYVESLFQPTVEKYGFNTFKGWADTSQTTALIFIRRDTILYEKYFNGFGRDSLFHSQSVAKSFISFLIGAAIDDELINSVNDPMTKYIPELKDRDPDFEKITIKNLLQMRSGLDYYEGYFPGTHIHLPWHDEVIGYYYENVRKYLLENVNIGSEPGKDFLYCNYNTSYLGLIIERATNKTVSQYLQDKLWSKIMEYDALFSVDSKESGFEYMPSRLIARAIDYARFGRLYLKEGNWEGEQIISKDWVMKSTREDKSIDRDIYPNWFFGDNCSHLYYSYQFWGHTKCDSTYQFAASGNLGQTIFVIPDKEIIIVHCGNSLQYYGDDVLWNVAEQIQ